MIISCASLWGVDQGNSKYLILDNGLQIFIQERNKLPLINIAFGINVGSKDESPESNGIVHLLEHLILSGGTGLHKGTELIRETRKRGAFLNAHTDHDLMTLEISLPADHLEFALNLVKEKIFYLKLIKEEVEREKKIISEEINQVKDDPVRFGTYLVLQNLFKGHTYSKPIFGDKEIIKNATLQQLETFYNRFFTPANCALSIIGKFKLADVENKTKKVFGTLKKAALPAAKISPCQPLKKSIEIEEKLDIDQAYIIIGVLAPPFNHEDHFAMNLLSYILGKGLNPLLNLALSGRRRLAEGLSTRYFPLKYGGVFLVYVITEPGHRKTAAREVIKLFRRTRTFRYTKKDFPERDQSLVFDYLESAKNQVRLSSEQANEEGLHAAISYAQYMLLTAQEINEKSGIADVAANHLRNAGARYLSGEKYVVVTLLPAAKASKKNK